MNYSYADLWGFFSFSYCSLLPSIRHTKTCILGGDAVDAKLSWQFELIGDFQHLWDSHPKTCCYFAFLKGCPIL